LQRFSPILFLLFYFTIFAPRLRLARSFFFTIFFSANNISAVAFAIPICPVAGQTIIGNSKTLSLSFRDRKLFLNGYKIDKTASRLRRG
jgi:hypothetical protein